MTITAVSLFSGCGGFDLGAKKAGVRILWANDRDPWAGATYGKLLPEVEFTLGDIRQIDKRSIPSADILVGCYPCQGFSIAAWRRWRDRGKRDLLSNTENYLFREFMLTIPHVNPKIVFIENVRGLVSSAGGWFYEEQKAMLERAGYQVYPQRLNAKDYGVAQSRQRIFIVGTREDLGFAYRFPAPTHGPGRPNSYCSQRDRISDLPLWPKGDFEAIDFHGHYLTRNRKRPWESYSYTIVAHSHHVPLHPMGEPMQYVSKDNWRLRGTENRRLSWRECSLLQSFDEDFEPEGPLSSKYAQVGNAVPPRLACVLVKPAADFLRGDPVDVHRPWQQELPM